MRHAPILRAARRAAHCRLPRERPAYAMLCVSRRRPPSSPLHGARRAAGTCSTGSPCTARSSSAPPVARRTTSSAVSVGAVLIDVLVQPAVQRAELAALDLGGDLGMRAPRGREELRRSGCCRACSPGTRRRSCPRTSARPAARRRGRPAPGCRSPPRNARATRAGRSLIASRPSSMSSSRSKRSMTWRLYVTSSASVRISERATLLIAR